MTFEHFLAAKLGMIVSEMRERMSNAEFVTWSAFYGRKMQTHQLAAAAGHQVVEL